MSNDKTRCEPCEQDFRDNIDRIVREGRAPKGSEHDAHEKELKAAFGADDRNASKHPTGYPTNSSANASAETNASAGTTDSERTSAPNGDKGYPSGDTPNPDRNTY